MKRTGGVGKSQNDDHERQREVNVDSEQDNKMAEKTKGGQWMSKQLSVMNANKFNT